MAIPNHHGEYKLDDDFTQFFENFDENILDNKLKALMGPDSEESGFRSDNNSHPKRKFSDFWDSQFGISSYVEDDNSVHLRFPPKTPDLSALVGFIKILLHLGVDNELEGKILNPSYLDRESRVFSNLQQIIRNSGTSAVAWVGEVGGAYNSGHNHVTNAFLMSFWYLDQLGMAATYDTKTYCRQTLVGGNYGLLNTNTFAPNPDYYSALLWHRLMGKQVLSSSVNGMKMLRSYAHCSKQSEGVTLLLINLDTKTTFQVIVSTERGLILGLTTGPIARKSKFTKMPITKENIREEYHLTAPNRKLSSQRVILNGRLLSVKLSGEIPILEPVTVNTNNPIKVGPISIVFVHMPSVISSVCK